MDLFLVIGLLLSLAENIIYIQLLDQRIAAGMAHLCEMGDGAGLISITKRLELYPARWLLTHVIGLPVFGS